MGTTSTSTSSSSSSTSTTSSSSSSSTSTSTTSTTAASTTTALTTILYPTGQPTVNYEDAVLVSYESPWQGANLTVVCEKGEGLYVSYGDDDLSSSGVLELSPIEGTLNLLDYPSECHIMLQDSTDSGQWIYEGAFTITSTSGAVKTYGASSTVTASSTQSASATSNSASSSTTTSSSLDASSSLSGGAKAGLVVSVLLLCFLLVAAFIYCRRRRRLNGFSKHAPDESEAAANVRPTPAIPDEAYIRSLIQGSSRRAAAAAASSSMPAGPKVVLSADDMRQSGDWKKFFSTKAASAAGAAAAMGSAIISNSRPGSRLMSAARGGRPRGADHAEEKAEQKELPQVPPLLDKRASVATTVPNSMSHFSGDSSMAGDAAEYMSTASLVATAAMAPPRGHIRRA